MVVVSAAPPNRGLAHSGSPQVHPQAEVDPTAVLAGEVSVARGAVIGAGTSVQVAQGGAFHLGEAALLQPGVTVYALREGRVLGDDSAPYSVWIGSGTAIAHRAIIHGPVYVGEGCAIGFRSMVFNARIGKGCVVMMHALVQDVEIPPGKLVPSGTTLTQQDQVNDLPDVSAEDLAFAQEVFGAQQTPASGATPPQGWSPSAPVSSQPPSRLNQQSIQPDGSSTMQTQKLTPDVVQQVRQLLSQGYRIGSEHADSRRFRSNVWQTCSPIQSTREGDVLAALEACLAEHSSEYVRIFGIDPVAKRRVAAVTIQRPDGKPVQLNTGSGPAGRAAAPAPSYRPSASGGNGLGAQLIQQVRQLLAQGFRIGTEHADSRRFRSNVWYTCSPIQSTRESEVMGALEACLAEHSGEYVRMFGIDPVAKCRVSPVTIQRPDGQPVNLTSGAAGTQAAAGSNSSSAGGLNNEVVSQVRQFINQGYQVGAEYADSRRYRSNVWQTCPPVKSNRESDVLASLASCLSAHQGEYVRIFGIDPKAKRRVAAITVQRPNASATTQPAATAPASASRNGYGGAAASNGSGNGAAPQVAADLAQQVSQLINQGYRVGLEHADVRRYRSGAWQTGSSIQGNRPSEVMAQLEAQLRELSGEYVRLIGIDPRAKRRVLETTIQRP